LHEIERKQPPRSWRLFFVAGIYEMSTPVTLFSKTCQGDMSRMNVVMEAVSSENGKKVVKVTLRQVAELAGVSLTTASRVLNGHASVSTQVRERVWQVINENGYQPDQAARSLAARRARKKQ
jgi:hypothetical protein